jgi:hypothetical protein
MDESNPKADHPTEQPEQSGEGCANQNEAGDCTEQLPPAAGFRAPVKIGRNRHYAKQRTPATDAQRRKIATSRLADKTRKQIAADTGLADSTVTHQLADHRTAS